MQDRVSITRTEFSAHTDNRGPNLVTTHSLCGFYLYVMLHQKSHSKKKKKKSRHNNLNFRLPSMRDKEKINRE